MDMRKPLKHYLKLQYPFHAIADPDGGFVVTFPDLPGCMTQVDAVDDIGPMAEDARRLWIESEYEAGEDIPSPTYPQPYSGKFNARIPKTLHRKLVEEAEREGVSLNQYVVTLLSTSGLDTTATPVSARRRLNVASSGRKTPDRRKAARR
ncbi:MAG: type II toxin-antitoxin system HicB family antitoxin [Dehalococcoidia bacterium]